MGLDVEKIENMSFVLLYLLKKGSGERLKGNLKGMKELWTKHLGIF